MSRNPFLDGPGQYSTWWMVDRSSVLGARAALVALWLAVSGLPTFLTSTTPASAQLTQTVITGPPGSGSFGWRVAYLPSGDYIVSDPYFDLPEVPDVGAVHLYRGSDNILLATLTGSTALDRIGSDGGAESGVRVLPDGNYLVRAPDWDQPSPAIVDAGAVVWCSGATGCSGVVSATNAAVGSSANDLVGRSVGVLSNGNYLVNAGYWDDASGPVLDAGAVRFCNATTGCFGPLTAANSLIGSSESDLLISASVPLPNGNYVVAAQSWDDPSPTPRADVGAVTFCNGTTGCVGTISDANSLVGTTANDGVGSPVALSDGNYVVRSSAWDKGAIANAGAVTWCSGSTGCAPGPVTEANSLTGANAGDSIGNARPLPGGAYVVNSFWVNQSSGGRLDVGAIRWCGAGGTGCTGSTVTSANSLFGARGGDLHDVAVVPVGVAGAFAVSAPLWNEPETFASDVGRVIFCNETTHCQGETSTAANSLFGSTDADKAGELLVPLANGNYVVGSREWDNGALVDVGAVTFCSGTTGCQGPITPANSYTGVVAGDLVGNQIVALANGNYVVGTSIFDDGPLVDAGAVRLCSGTTGCFGTPSSVNSLVGSTLADAVGSLFVSPVGDTRDRMGITALPNGDYLVRSPNFDDGAVFNVGAVTRCSGTSGCIGTIGTVNSLLGTLSQDRVGEGVVVFPSGHHVIASSSVENPIGPVPNAGAFTFGSDIAGLVGRIDASNSVFGAQPFDLFSLDYDAVRERYLVGRIMSNRVVVVEVPEPGWVAGLSAGLLALSIAHSGVQRAR